MKKKFFIILGLIILIVLVSFSLYIKHNKKIQEKNNLRYEEIKENVKAEVIRYANIVHPICKDNDAEIIITHKTLVLNGGFDKEKLLDVDNESYCSVYALSGCDVNEEHYYKSYIKCNNYEEKGFIQWDESFPSKE